ncbi:MAG TPA: hypothetical protein VG963_03935, partial [Polyangiaceae bacterium]|nr:hypothetical protein [Polyangiaceae bacterium]
MQGYGAQLFCVAITLLACSQREDGTTLGVAGKRGDPAAAGMSTERNGQGLIPDDSSAAAAANPAPRAADRFVLASIVIDADGNRVSYAQLVDSLQGHFGNSGGIEAQGNAAVLAQGEDFFYGLQES